MAVYIRSPSNTGITMNQPSDKIEFEPIPCQEDRGYVCLCIYPPETFINNKEFLVMVGGCGCGRAPTLKKAEKLLLQRAKEYCERQIAQAKAQMKYYSRQLDNLRENGLGRPKVK